MKFVWKGSKSAPEAKTLTVKVGGNAPIVFTKDVPYQFQHDAHYRPYKPRMESLIRDQSSGFTLLAREYPPRVYPHQIEENKRKAAPPPAKTWVPKPSAAEADKQAVADAPKLPITSVQDFREEALEKVKLRKKEEAATAKRLARNAAQAKATKAAKLDAPAPAEPADGDVLSKSAPELRAMLQARGVDTNPDSTRDELLELF